jgi:glycosyltransferase involved in cell wall biosynthesis
MRILFCSDALIVDGVTSFVLHLAVTLRKGGHRVAVLGRWAGKGFQSRLREHGVEIIQCLSPTVGNAWFDRKAAAFAPEVIVTDSRRSFPLAVRLKRVTGAKVFTFFLDHLEKTDRKGRDVPSLIAGSDAWLSAEPPILERLEEISTPFPKFLLRRPLVHMVTPTPLRAREPFRVLCFGRLSGYKSAGPWALMNDALALKKEIPSLQLVFVGGGWRSALFRFAAFRANLDAGERFIRVAGTQTDPNPWFEEATLVCAGSTSAVEAALAFRPVVVFTGFWIGLLTPEKLDAAFASYFGERSGTISVRQHPELLSAEIRKVYGEWEQGRMEEMVRIVRQQVMPSFDDASTVEEFERICRIVTDGAGASGSMAS